MRFIAERRIEQGMGCGEFDNLAGAGQPIEDLDAPRDELWWVKKWIKRENLELPPLELHMRRKVRQFIRDPNKIEPERGGGEGGGARG